MDEQCFPKEPVR